MWLHTLTILGYGKMLFFVKLFFLLVVCALINGSWGAGGVKDYESNNIARGFDAKNLLSTLATSLMSRGYGSTGMGSQVISLNLTNLLILILLKALIFAAASLAGHKGGGGGEEHYARSAEGEENKLLTDEEVLMFLSYLTGSPGDNGCLQNIACHQPHQAKKYVNAGDVLLKAAKMFSYQTDDTYDYVIKEVDHAANVGIAGGNCQIFKCSNNENS